MTGIFLTSPAADGAGDLNGQAVLVLLPGDAMARPHPITAKPGGKSGEFVLTLPPGWELRLRRVLKEILADALPDARTRGLTQSERAARVQLRRRRLQAAICQYVGDLVTADIVGKEVALATRNRFGARTGSLREHVQAILREVGER